MSDEFDFVEFDGHKRYLAKLPPRRTFGDIPAWNKGTMPKSEWRTIDRRGKWDFILDQNGYNSCVGNGSVGGLRRARLIEGMTDIALSPGFCYAHINGGRDQGAVISDALEKLKSAGTCTFAEVGQKPFYLNQLPKSSFETAKRFRILEAYHASEWLEIMTGVQLGFVAVYGIQVGNSFMTLDSNGVAGYTRGPGNHCMAADGARPAGSDWGIDNFNSWGLNYGQNGRCLLTERHFESIDPDCFLIRAASDDPQEPGPPPVS